VWFSLLFHNNICCRNTPEVCVILILSVLFIHKLTKQPFGRRSCKQHKMGLDKWDMKNSTFFKHSNYGSMPGLYEGCNELLDSMHSYSFCNNSLREGTSWNSRHISCSLGTGWVFLDSIPDRCKEFSLLLYAHTPYGPPSLLFNWCRGSFLGVKRPWREVYHWLQPNAKVKNECSSTPIYLIWLHAVERAKFTFLRLHKNN
jgi:hypothetical protein